MVVPHHDLNAAFARLDSSAESGYLSFSFYLASYGGPAVAVSGTESGTRGSAGFWSGPFHLRGQLSFMGEYEPFGVYDDGFAAVSVQDERGGGGFSVPFGGPS